MPVVGPEFEGMTPLRQGGSAEVPMPQEPEPIDTVAAFWRLDNTIVGAYDALTEPTFKPQAGYEPIKRIQAEKIPEPAWNYFAGARSDAEFDFIKQKVAKEERDKATLQASGWMPWLAGMVTSGLADPVNLLPMAKGAKAFKTALLVGAGTLAEEGVLQKTQVTRTLEESAINVGGSLIIAGGLQRLTNHLGKRGLDKLSYDAVNAPDVPNISREAGGASQATLKPVVGTYVVRQAEGIEHLDATGLKPGKQTEAQITVDNGLLVTPESLPLIREEMGNAKATMDEIVAWARSAGKDAVIAEGFEDMRVPRTQAANLDLEYGGLAKVAFNDLAPNDQRLILEAAQAKGVARDEALRIFEERGGVSTDDLLQLRQQVADASELIPDQVRVLDPAKVELGDDVTGQTFDPVRFGTGVEHRTIDEADEITREGQRMADAGAKAHIRETAGASKESRGLLHLLGNVANGVGGPIVRLKAQRVSKVAQDVASSFTDAGMTRAGNVVMGPDGLKAVASSEGGSIQGNIQFWKGLVRGILNDNYDNFLEFKRTGGQLSRNLFNKEVTRAIRLGDEYDGPGGAIAKKSADMISTKFYKPLGAEAVRYDLFDLGEVLENYVRQDWSKEEIGRRPVDFKQLMTKLYSDRLQKAYQKALEKQEAAALKDTEEVGALRRPLAESEQELEKLNKDLDNLQHNRLPEVVEAEERALELRQQAAEIGEQLKTEKDPAKRRPLTAQKKAALEEARKLEKGEVVAKTREERTAIKRRMNLLTRSAGQMGKRQQAKLLKAARSDELQTNSMIKFGKQAQKLLNKIPALAPDKLATELAGVRNKWERLVRGFDKAEAKRVALETGDEPDVIKLLDSNDEVVQRMEAVTDLAGYLDELERFPRDEAIARINEAVAMAARKVQGLNKRRALAQAKRLQEAKKLDPKIAEGRALMLEKRTRQRELDFNEYWRQQGYDEAQTATNQNFLPAAEGLAEDFYRRIMGNTGRLGNLEVAEAWMARGGPRGSALARTMNFDFREIEEFLELDIEKLMRTAERTVASDVEVSRRWGNTSADEMFDLINQEEKAIKANIEADPKLTPEQKNNKVSTLGKQFESVRRDANGLLARARNKLGLGTNPESVAMRFGDTLQNLAALTKLGGVLLSSIPDIGKLISQRTVNGVFRDAFLPFIRMTKEERRMLKREARNMNLITDALRISYNEGRFTDDLQYMGNRSKGELGLEYAASKMGLVAGFDQWTNLMKTLSSMNANMKMMDSLAVVMGEAQGATKKQVEDALEWLGRRNITGEHARTIWAQTKKSGQKVKGTWLLNTDKWDVDKREVFDALRVYRQAVNDEVNNIVVTPGMEMPLMASNPFIRPFFFLKGFALASTTKTLVAGLQEWDARVMTGWLTMLVLGGMSTYFKALSYGTDSKQYKEMQNAGPAWWALHMFADAGLAGAFQLPVDAFAPPLLGVPSRFDPTREFTPPAVDATRNVAGIMSDLLAREPTKATLHKATQVLPFSNLFYLRGLLDDVEDGVGDVLGLPEKRGERRATGGVRYYQ